MAQYTKTLAQAYGPIFLLLLFFGALYATTLDSHGMFIWDEAEYASLARSVLRGEGFAISGVPNPLRPPVLPLTAAVSMFVCNSSREVVLKLPNIFFSLFALCIVYWCARTQFGSVTGCVAAALLGLFPTFWHSTTFLLTEMPFMAFFTGAVVCFYWGLYRARHFFYWSWLCCGLAALTRYTAVLFAPIVIVFLALALVSRHPEACHNVRSKDFFLSPLVGGVVMIPWLIRQQVTFGDALVGFKQATTQLQVYLPGISMPWYFYPLQLPLMISWIPTLLLCLGIWWAMRTRDRFALHCLLVCVGILFWFSCYRFKEVRQVTGVLPFLAILASLGATKYWMSEPPTLRFLGLLVLLLGGMVTMNGLAMRQQLTHTVALGYPSFSHAMQFLRAQTSAEAVLVGANYPQIHWYTDRRAIDFPDESQLQKVLEGSAWVIVTNFERGQRDYVHGLLKKVTRYDVQGGNAAIFRDRQFFTALIRSSLLQERL
jgi:4-amino-4-deoxy-L-arabinose transferase-like glycosyltransferase